MTTKRSLATTLFFALLLTGCSASPDPSNATGPSNAADPSEAADPSTAADPSSSPAEGSTTEADAVAGPPAECEGILFEENAVIPGKQLGDCMAAAMRAAGSGSHRVDSSDGESSTVEFEWTPAFSMVIDGSSAVVVRGNTGWVKMGGGWVQADPGSTDGQVVMATSIVKLVRVFGDPRTLAAGIAANDWRIVGEGSVPVSDALADVAWQLVPTSGSVSFGPVKISDYELWLGSDYLGVYSVGTGSMGDVAVTTSNTFLQWGEPVEIPDPTKP